MREGFDNKKGFTLIELIVVIAIIAILAAILVPSLMAYMEKAGLRRADSNVKNVYTSATSAYAQLLSEGKLIDDTTLKAATAADLGAEFDANSIDVKCVGENHLGVDGVISVSWADGSYWAVYTTDDATIRHGRGSVPGAPGTEIN